MQAKMLTPERCWLFHRWHVVHDTGFTVYAVGLTDTRQPVIYLPWAISILADAVGS